MERILLSLLENDNERRRDAEIEITKYLDESLSYAIESLLTILSDPKNGVMMRSLAAVLLRRAIEKLSPGMDTVSNVKSVILQIWERETEYTLVRKICHILAQIYVNFNWSDMFHKLISCNQNRSLFYLIEIMADYGPVYSADSLNLLGTFLSQHIASPDYASRVLCSKAILACIVSIEDENQRNMFKAAIASVVNILGETLSKGDEADSNSIMELLVTIANIQPVFFKGMVDQLVKSMISVAASPSFEFATRSIAIEFIVTLSETAPALARRCDFLVSELTPILFQFIIDCDINDIEWSQEKYSDDAILDGDYIMAEECIERLAAGMGGRVVVPTILKFCEMYYTPTITNWKIRRAAIVAVGRLVEGCPQYFSKHHYQLSLKPFLLTALQDSHPIIKYEVLQIIGRLADLFENETKDIITTFTPSLLPFLHDTTACEKVRGHAVSTCTNVLANPETVEKDMIKPYLNDIMNALLVCIQNSTITVQQHCLIMVGGIAKVIEEDFAPYYTSFMPGIKLILTQALGPDMTLLRAKAMECVGLLGEAVGADIFASDALDVMNTLLRALESDGQSDMTYEYILPACARISNALESQFEPFLPLVMGPLLSGAVQVIDFSMEDAQEDDVEGEVNRDEDTGTESTVISLGAGIKKRVTLNTFALQQKQQAARMIFEFAKSMKGHLKNYLIPLIQAVLKMITEKHSADVRSSACLALSKLYEGYLHAIQCNYLDSSQVSEVLSACLGKLLENLKGEINCTSRACAAESLRDILLACYMTGTESIDGSRQNPLCAPDITIGTAICTELLSLCHDSILRKQQKELEFQLNEGMEEEDRSAVQEELEEEEETLTNLVDAIGQFFKLYGEAFMSYFDLTLAPIFAPYLQASQPVYLQILAICMIDDVIEFGGSSAHKYIPQLIPIFLANMKSDHPVLRQCSIYGLAQSLRFAPEICVSHTSTIVPSLMTYVTSQVYNEENEGSIENAVYALGTIYHNRMYHTVSWNNYTPAMISILWLEKLPLKADENEAKIAHHQLCDAIESGDINILGENYKNLNHVLRIMADVFLEISENSKNSSPSLPFNGQKTHDSTPLSSMSSMSSMAHTTTIHRMQTIIRQMIGPAGGLNKDFLGSVFQSLSSGQQQVLQQLA